MIRGGLGLLENRKTRFLSDMYDSVQQRRVQQLLVSGLDPHAAMLGRLRFDTLLAERLVLPDTQLLDGSYFTTLDPNQLLEDLRRTPDELAPLEIRTRRATLPDALIGFVRRADTDTKPDARLAPFTFSLLPTDAAQRDVREHLQTVPAARCRTVPELIHVLRDAGIDQAQLERMHEGWARWFVASETGKLTVAPWDGSWDVVTPLNSQVSPLPEEPTEVGRVLLEWIRANPNIRSQILERLDDAERGAGDDELRDVQLVRYWYQRAYHILTSAPRGHASSRPSVA